MNIVDFQKRKLKEFYVAVYVVPKEIIIRTDSCIANKILYVLVGVDIIGYRQVLGMYFENENDNRFWLEKFEDLKARNVRRILFFVTPKSKNIERCIKIIYNDTRIIHSPDEAFSSIIKFFSDKPSRKMQTNLKDLFFCKDIEEYKINFEMFKEIYIDNKLISILLTSKQQTFEEFYQYSCSLRKLLYPYYLIKEFKKHLNKLKTRQILCLNINEVIEASLPLIDSFEHGRSYSKAEWLELISSIYEEYDGILEEYING